MMGRDRADSDRALHSKDICNGPKRIITNNGVKKNENGQAQIDVHHCFQQNRSNLVKQEKTTQ